jgi:hypothetical protein
MRFEPSLIYGSAGDIIYVTLLDDNGKVLPIKSDRCIVFTGPDRTSAHIVDFGKRLYPISVIHKEGMLEVIITGDCPSFIIYRDSETQQAVTLDIHVAPAHDHRRIDQGGPAVGVFDSFQV